MKRLAQETQTLTAEIVTDMRRLLAHRTRPVRIMEVCGTHTVAIFRAGLRQILPAEIELVSGPGCPVCVTGDCLCEDGRCHHHDVRRYAEGPGDGLQSR